MCFVFSYHKMHGGSATVFGITVCIVVFLSSALWHFL